MITTEVGSPEKEHRQIVQVLSVGHEQHFSSAFQDLRLGLVLEVDLPYCLNQSTSILEMSSVLQVEESVEDA